MSDFSPLQPLFAKKAAQQNVSATLQKAHVCFLMNRLLAEKITKKSKTAFAKATDLKNRTIIITVSSSGMAQEVMLHRTELLAELHTRGYTIQTIRTQLT